MDPNQDDEPLGEIADDGEPRALNALPLQTGEHPLALPGIQKVMRRFNRTTMWVATGLLGTLIFAALVLAVQERHPMAANLAEEARQTSGELLPNASTAALSEVVGSSGKSTDEITPGQATNFDHGFTPEINHPEAQANVSSWSPAQRHDSARVIRPKIPNVRYRSSMRSRFVDVKMRLIALWHQSLARSEKSRSWTLL
jgi:cytoskeletal protein RodZ